MTNAGSATNPNASIIAAHRAFYDAIESGDIDLMRALWVDSSKTSCIHPVAAPILGTSAILRSWTLIMASVDYIQFFLTDVTVNHFGAPGSGVEVASVVCTENILSDGDSVESFHGGIALSTSFLMRVGGRWQFWSRHASPVATATQADSTGSDEL